MQNKLLQVLSALSRFPFTLDSNRGSHVTSKVLKDNCNVIFSMKKLNGVRPILGMAILYLLAYQLGI